MLWGDGGVRFSYKIKLLLKQVYLLEQQEFHY